MTQANKALFDFQDDIMEMTSDSHKTIIRALDLLDMVERGGEYTSGLRVEVTRSHYCEGNSINGKIDEIEEKYILIDRSKL